MRNSFTILLLMFLFIYLFAVPVNAKDKHVTDCLEAQEDCQDLYDSSVEKEADQENADSDITKMKTGSLFVNIIKMIIALLFILGLIYALLGFIKRKNHLFREAGVMENLGGISVGQQKSIQLIRIGDAMYIIGVGDNVELLQKIEDETLKNEIMEQKESALQTPKFFQSIWKNKSISSENKSDSFTKALQHELTKLKTNRSKLLQEVEKREDKHV